MIRYKDIIKDILWPFGNFDNWQRSGSHLRELCQPLWLAYLSRYSKQTWQKWLVEQVCLLYIGQLPANPRVFGREMIATLVLGKF